MGISIDGWGMILLLPLLVLLLLLVPLPHQCPRSFSPSGASELTPEKAINTELSPITEPYLSWSRIYHGAVSIMEPARHAA